MTWQPIETAPKDGTEILGLWSGHNHCYAVTWFEDEQWHEYELEIELSSPTHWMPLPEPPA